jgi:hypothetical protein
MICIKAEIPEELNKIDDELKAIYHSRETVCFYLFKTRELRNEFVERTKGMNKEYREKVYELYKKQINHKGKNEKIKMSLWISGS